jgi:hypothetical protein
MTRERPRDEGAEYTGRVMGEVKRLRAAKGWSAQRLAEEMTAAGVPWNTDIVVNLEHGRRKSLRVHELLALAWCLDVDSPVDLLVPGPDDTAFPVVPRIRMAPEVVRAWCQGTTGPLRRLAEKSPDEIWAIRLEMESLEQVAEQMLRLARSGIPGVHRREDRTDGQD